MYGEVLIKPWELHRMTFRDVVLTITGLRDRDEMLESWHRRVAAIAGGVMGGKNFNIDKIWPVRKKKISGESRALQTLAKFREMEAIERAKKKLNGRRS